MKKVMIGFGIGLLLAFAVGTAAQAAPPRSVEVYTGSGAILNVGPGDDVPPPQITIYTPHGIVNPTL